MTNCALDLELRGPKSRNLGLCHGFGMDLEILKGTTVVWGYERGDLCKLWIVSVGWFWRF